jgi:hypothetical protein
MRGKSAHEYSMWLVEDFAKTNRRHVLTALS